jgi:hypothetical protein
MSSAHKETSPSRAEQKAVDAHGSDEKWAPEARVM